MLEASIPVRPDSSSESSVNQDDSATAVAILEDKFSSQDNCSQASQQGMYLDFDSGNVTWPKVSWRPHWYDISLTLLNLQQEMRINSYGN